MTYDDLLPKRIIKINTPEQVFLLDKIINKYLPDTDVDVRRGRYQVSARSVLGVLSLDLSQPITAVLQSTSEQDANNFTIAIDEFEEQQQTEN